MLLSEGPDVVGHPVDDDRDRQALDLALARVVGAVEEVLEYWSSGSTSLYGLKGAGKQTAAEHED